MNNPCGPVPLLFITGFLGSGKTTLLNRILDEAAAQGKKIGVIINEWGRVNIDSSLIRAKDILTTGRFSAVAFPAIFWRLLSCSPSVLWMS
jgi:Ni2+-binding GTPase involved in maturation of urease and hydrogenase